MSIQQQLPVSLTHEGDKVELVLGFTGVVFIYFSMYLIVKD